MGRGMAAKIGRPGRDTLPAARATSSACCCKLRRGCVANGSNRLLRRLASVCVGVNGCIEGKRLNWHLREAAERERPGFKIRPCRQARTDSSQGVDNAMAETKTKTKLKSKTRA